MKIDKEFIVNFLAGGTLIAVCGYISKYYSVYLSGFLYGSLPFAAYYLYFYAVYINKGRKKDGIEFINGCISGGALWILFIALLYPFHHLFVLKN